MTTGNVVEMTNFVVIIYLLSQTLDYKFEEETIACNALLRKGQRKKEDINLGM